MSEEIATLRWMAERLNEHMGRVAEMERLGRTGEMFALGSDLTQLRHMLLSNQRLIENVLAREAAETGLVFSEPRE